MKKTMIVIFCLLILVSCRQSTTEHITIKLQEKIDEFKNYTCTSTLIVNNKAKSTTYIVEESFIKPDIVNIKIIEPKESEGFIIKYEGNKVFIEHPTIEQSISIENIKTFNKNLSIGNIFGNLQDLDEYIVEMETIKDEEYIVLTLELLEKNKYRNTQKIWIKKKDFVPYKSNILDEEGNINLEIYYQNFQYDIL